MLFQALQGLQHDGIRLLLSDRIPSGIHLAKQIKLALKFLNELELDEPYEKFRFDLQELGFEPGWGNTAARVSQTLELLDRLIYSPQPGILETFVARVPAIFRVVLISIHGWVGQEDVLGRDETLGQVIYVLEQARSLEKELREQIKLAGLDVLGMKPHVIILTRLIPNCEGTFCNLRLEKVQDTENAWILRVPFSEFNPEITNNRISKFEIWPYLENFALDAEKELLAQFQGKPNLIVGNYSDGNLVAFILSRRMKVTQCNIAHSSEKVKVRHCKSIWDTEIFMLPFFLFTQPAIARNLLSYRWHTLPGARRKASHYGYKGAMFAWESADTGDEVTPRWGLNSDFYGEDVRIWCRDREIHINADIPYAAWNYWQATGDDQWMQQRGAEIILDAAIFWGSRVEFNSERQRYEIRGVIGVDEYYEFVHNNAFTNRMAQWHLEKAIAVYDWLADEFPERVTELEEKLKLTPQERTHWQDIITKILFFHDSLTELIEQFEGFFQLEDINLADYQGRDRSVQAILGIEKTNKYQVIKQPDILMLLYLMRESADFPYNKKALQTNWDYYAPRTDITYGSSLGPAVHAILASDLGKSSEAYQVFMQALMVDLEDNRGNTSDGIHGATAGGVWQAVIFGFGGIQLTENGPVANSHLPDGWTRLKFKLHWQGKWHDFDLHQGLGIGHGALGMGHGNKGRREQGDKGKTEITNAQSPMPDIKGFIFDLDGVLTDTAVLHYQAWQKLADEEGIPFNRQANEALRGVSRRVSLMLIIGDRPYSEAQIEEMMERKNRYYVELIQNMTPKDLLPGAIAFLDELRQAGIKIGIGSGSKNARTVIERLGIADKIDAIADGYRVQQPKPAPDLFLYAAKQLGLEPAQSVVVEDAAAGVEAALVGGMWAVGLGPTQRVRAADVVLPSLEGVKWADLRTKLSNIPRQKHSGTSN